MSSTPISVEALTRLLRENVTKRHLVSGLGILASVGAGVYLTRKRVNQMEAEKEHRAQQDALEEATTGVVVKAKPQFNRQQFYKRLGRLLRIVLPSIYSKEAGILGMHTFFLFTRTLLSIYVAYIDGQIVRSIVGRSPFAFMWLLAKWLALSVPAVYTNSMIKYLEDKLAIAFRTRMSDHLYQKYMESETYYRVGNLDSRLTNADQCLTEDVSKFSSHLASLYSQLSKPMFDVVLMVVQLWVLITRQAGFMSGLPPLAGGVMCVWLTSKLLRRMSPPFGALVAKQAALEGQLRFVHSRLITNAEEIAFYRGHKIEHGVIARSYYALVKHMNLIFQQRVFYTMLEGFLMKYVWSAIGMNIIAFPTFLADYKQQKIEKATGTVEGLSSMGDRTQNYIVARKLLLDSADAVERIMLAQKQISELDGYVTRVTDMLDVFEDMHDGKFVKTMINNVDDDDDGAKAKRIKGEPDGEDSDEDDAEEESTTVKEKRIRHHDNGPAEPLDLTKPQGVVQEADYIQFDKVPIVSPNGDVLVESLSFEVTPGRHLLITGPNGCGKSSLFRILGGLWPVYRGSVVKPSISDMFYIPQRPYLAIGSLRDQVIYPHTVQDMHSANITDKDLDDIMEWVNLTKVVVREGGWDAVSDWKDVLSGGEKQRVAMARLFYHRPKYAILDECTSAVSVDVEGKMYAHAQDLGITLLTVTHRPSLWQYHNYLLQFDGEGGWQFLPLNATARMGLKEEKMRLEAQLQGMPTMHKRLRELCNLLGEDSIALQQE